MGQTSPQARARPRRLGREAGGSLSCCSRATPLHAPLSKNKKSRSASPKCRERSDKALRGAGSQRPSMPSRAASLGRSRCGAGRRGGSLPPGPPQSAPPPPPNPCPPRARRRSSQLGNPDRNPAGAFQKAGSGRGSTDGRDGARGGGGGSARTRGRRGRRAVARGRARGGVSRWGASPPPPPPSLFPHPPCPRPVSGGSM